jgi:magnesium transporter
MPSLDVPNTWDTLRDCIAARDSSRLAEFLDLLSPSETARAIAQLTPDEHQSIMVLLEPGEAADVVAEVPEVQAATMLSELTAPQAAAIIDELSSDRQVDLLGHLSENTSEAILDELPAEQAEETRLRMSYPPDTAGGLMATEYLAYDQDMIVRDLVHDLRENRDTYVPYLVQYVYVTNRQGRLVGVMQLRNLLFAPQSAPLRELMITSPLNVGVDAGLEELKNFFQSHSLIGVPVTDRERRLVGIVRRAAVEAASAKQVSRQFMWFSGIVGGEEFRSMSLITRSRRRLSWLTINIGLNIVSASIISYFADTLQAAIAIAVFLPMISDMSGCSGNQAVAVSIRELTLGIIRPRDVMRVWLKEGGLGLINGLALGLLLAIVAILWKGNPYLGLVVGSALAANTVVAVSVGGMVPLLMKAIRLDPAMVSGPILTTVTDMCNFFFTLGLATLLLEKLRSG